jgi:hypothetical protein
VIAQLVGMIAVSFTEDVNMRILTTILFSLGSMVNVIALTYILLNGKEEEETKATVLLPEVVKKEIGKKSHAEKPVEEVKSIEAKEVKVEEDKKQLTKQPVKKTIKETEILK